MNKRGQGLEVSTLILIVLGVIILVLLVLGFSMGWSSLWQKINIFQGGSNNVESVIQACKIAVTSNAAYTYCNDFKKIRINNEDVYVSCEYPDVASKLDSTLTCSGDAATTKCNELIKEAVKADVAKAVEADKEKACNNAAVKLTIKVNGNICSIDCSKIVGEIKSTLKTCTGTKADGKGFGGVWSKTPCGTDQTNVEPQVTDKSDKGDNVYCCVSKTP